MNDQINNLQVNIKLHMKKCITNFKEHINKIYIGRVSPNILYGIQVEYYGVLTPLSQLTNAVVENSRTLAITVFDQKMIKPIEKAILTSDLGLNPIISASIIRIILPFLTEERRLYLVKKIRIESEKSKISIRNIRRNINDKIKFLSKNKEINIEEEYCYQNKVQQLTDFYIKEIDTILIKKESEFMTF